MSAYLEEGGGDGNEESGSSPKKSTESDDVGTIVTHREISSERVTTRLD